MAVPRLIPIICLIALTVPIIIQIELTYKLQRLYHSWMPLDFDENEPFDFIVVGAGKIVLRQR